MTVPAPEDTGTDYGMLMPWMPDELIALYTEAYVEYGNADMAWAAVRQAPAYDQFFAGNRREDGTLRMSEQEYMSTLDAYDDVFQSVGLNPDLWKKRYVDLIEGDVSADELMAERVMPIYERIVEGGEFIRQQYADDWGLDMSFEAILAAAKRRTAHEAEESARQAESAATRAAKELDNARAATVKAGRR